MANFSELSGIKQWGLVILGGAAVTAVLYFTIFKSQNDKNVAAQHALEAKIRENNELESYRPKLKQIEQQLAELKQQLEIEQRIVPDEKQVDGFMTMMDGEAFKAGVEVRRYSAKDSKQQQYFTEVPFEMELEWPSPVRVQTRRKAWLGQGCKAGLKPSTKERFGATHKPMARLPLGQPHSSNPTRFAGGA